MALIGSQVDGCPYYDICGITEQEFGSSWFETGTPSYLVYLLQKHDYNLEQMSCVEADSDVLNSTDAESTNQIPVIYQSGYPALPEACERGISGWVQV